MMRTLTVSLAAILLAAVPAMAAPEAADTQAERSRERTNKDEASGSIAFEIGGVAISEPAAWAMAVAGFGLVGSTVRRRRGPPAVTA